MTYQKCTQTRSRAFHALIERRLHPSALSSALSVIATQGVRREGRRGESTLLDQGREPIRVPGRITWPGRQLSFLDS